MAAWRGGGHAGAWRSRRNGGYEGEKWCSAAHRARRWHGCGGTHGAAALRQFHGWRLARVGDGRLGETVKEEPRGVGVLDHQRDVRDCLGSFTGLVVGLWDV
jgi:hypothetical protein